MDTKKKYIYKRKSCPKCHYINRIELRKCKKCGSHIHKRVEPIKYNPLDNVDVEKKREVLKELFI